MNISYSKLTIEDINAVDELMKNNSKTLGFLPKKALKDCIGKKTVLGAKTDKGELAGYLLYGNTKNYFRITHLCVSDEFRGKGIAKELLKLLIDSKTTQKLIILNCRRDFSVNDMWPKLGFAPIGEKPGRSATVSTTLTIWQLRLSPDNQPTLFEAIISEEALDVVIDTQIFLAFNEQTDDRIEEKALISDFMADSLNIHIADEVLVEINRNNDINTRQTGRNKADTFLKIKYDERMFKHFEITLSEILPKNKPSDKSDIRYLAKTAASDVNIFVTKDKKILRKKDDISKQTNLQIMSPVELIIRQHELLDKQSYNTDRVSGIELKWDRLTSTEVDSFPFESFLKQGERKNTLKQTLNPFLLNPNRYIFKILKHKDCPIAIKVSETTNKYLSVHFIRLANSTFNNRSLFERFLIYNIVDKAVKKNLDMVKIKEASLPKTLIPHLHDTKFVKCNNIYTRFCFSQHLNQKQVISSITTLYPEATNNYQNMNKLELQFYCSPLSLDDVEDMKFFLIPIKSGYAMGLIDIDQSANDLFGGDKNKLLRWENVYYRAKTDYNILKPPARILWYETGNNKKVIASSYLDEVVIDNPKELYKKYKKLGILEWKDLSQICGSDYSKEIMALKFSHTFPFRQSVSLNQLQHIYKKHKNSAISVQKPLKLPKEVFQEIFKLGYSTQELK